MSRVADTFLDLSLRYALRGTGWYAHGVEIRVRLVNGERRPYAQMVATALGLIARHDPLRLARIRRDIRVILVSALVTPGNAGEYNRRHSVCMLDDSAILTAPAALVALWIVHEATHARVAALAPKAENITRIERICAKQELAFATKLPGSEQLQESLRDAVAKTSEVDYSHVGMAARGLAALEQKGAPKPVLMALECLARYTKPE